MKYAEVQLTRPQCEHGADYGPGRRSVLVRNGKQELLHVAGQKHWGGIGRDQQYIPSKIALWSPDSVVGGVTGRQRTLHEGRLGKDGLVPYAEKIFNHLGRRFDLKLVSLKHTLLLDVKGKVAGPPPRAPRKLYPKVESQKLFEVVLDNEDQPRLVEVEVISQRCGRVSLRSVKSGRSRGTYKIDSLFQSLFGRTPHEAGMLFVRQYEERHARRASAIQSAVDSEQRALREYERIKNAVKALELEK